MGTKAIERSSLFMISQLYSNNSKIKTVIKKRFKNVIVALDRDATTKAFDIAREVGMVAHTRVVMLEDDLKYFKPEMIAGH